VRVRVAVEVRVVVGDCAEARRGRRRRLAIEGNSILINTGTVSSIVNFATGYIFDNLDGMNPESRWMWVVQE